jgi:hypothetical protein
LKVAALLDSDAAGEQAAQQDNLVHTLGNNRILRTKDYLSSEVQHSEIEDLLRDTLLSVVNSEYGTDLRELAQQQSQRPIVNLFEQEIEGFSKYRLAKAYLRWTRESEAAALTETEQGQWAALIKAVNNSLK